MLSRAPTCGTERVREVETPMRELDGCVRLPGDECSTEDTKASTVLETSGGAQTFDRERGLEDRRVVSQCVEPAAFDQGGSQSTTAELDHHLNLLQKSRVVDNDLHILRWCDSWVVMVGNMCASVRGRCGGLLLRSIPHLESRRQPSSCQSSSAFPGLRWI